MGTLHTLGFRASLFLIPMRPSSGARAERPDEGQMVKKKKGDGLVWGQVNGIRTDRSRRWGSLVAQQFFEMSMLHVFVA